MRAPSAPAARTLTVVSVLGLLVLAMALPRAVPQVLGPGITVAAMGDFGILMVTERNVDRAVAGGAQGLLGLGDYNYDGSLRGWNAMAQPLTSKGAWFVLGNHDDQSSFQDRMPNGTPQWSILLGGARVVAVNTEQDLSVGSNQSKWLAGELAREPASMVKVVVLHRPWWLGPGANHPSTEFPGSPEAMDALMVANGVDLVLAAHEHNYQRTSRNAIPYLIVGTGGHRIESVVGSDPATAVTCACVGHLLLSLSDTAIAARFIDVDGREQDSIRWQLVTPSPSPTGSGFSASFKNVRGNNNWVETDVVANKPLAGVDARVDGGAWTGLTKQSWGSWAKAMSAATGSTVEFRARAASGETSQSAGYTWPPGPSPTPTPTPTSTSPAPTTSGAPFTASFKNARGNEWWVEIEVTANQPVAGVDARVNGGAWTALTKQSWGSWAKSLHAAAGSLVEFQAKNANGEGVKSAPYTWPPP